VPISVTAWPKRERSSTAEKVGSWVWIPREVWMFVRFSIVFVYPAGKLWNRSHELRVWFIWAEIDNWRIDDEIRIESSSYIPVVILKEHNFARWFPWIWNLSLTSCEELMLTALEKRMVRCTFGPNGNEIIGGWTQLHIEEHHNMYSSNSSPVTSPSGQIVRVLQFTIRRLFVSSCCLFNTKCFGLTGHHHVYKVVDENCCPVFMLLYFAFYESIF
jgi:hypothetical protein